MLWKKKKIRKKVRTTEVNKIVTAVLKKDDISYADEAYQWNYGQILRIQGGNLPKAVEVHFSLEETSGTSVTRIGTTTDGVTEASIPDSLLENNNCSQGYTIYAYIYLEDGTAGRTEYEIAIPVKARTKPEVPGTPEEPELFRETVKAVNDAADRAEQAEQNAKASATEASKYAASASESAVAAEKTKEDALREVGEKKQEAIEAIREQEETSVGKITTHTDDEIQRVQSQTAESKGELEQTITDASVANKKLEESIRTAGDTKKALDKSTELAGTAKTELDTSIREAGEAKTALDGSTNTAGEMQETLSATVKQAGALDTFLGEKIETGTQLKTDLTASGEKAVQDIQNAGSEQLGKMQAVAEEFTADRGQITTNREDISSLKEEMGKNYLDDAKVKRSLDALWKLNQGISYQFETDDSKAYQKDIPSGAKLAGVKKIGGRTVVWNQLIDYSIFSNYTNNGVYYKNNNDGTITIIRNSAQGNSSYSRKLTKQVKVEKNHIYYSDCFYDDARIIDGLKSLQPSIGTATDNGVIDLRLCVKQDIELPLTIPITLFDFTKMFGAGNEPSTPEEFEALFPENYYEYNEGTLMSMPVNEVVEKGKNLFDEKMELGLINYDVNSENFGKNITSKNQLRSTNYIPVEPNAQYFLNSDRAIAFLYDVERKIIKTGSNGYLSMGKLFTTPSNARYLRFYLTKEYGITYNSDLMLTKGATSAYSPYHKNTYPIPQAILDLDGYGDGVSDDVYNYVDWEEKKYHKRVGRVDLGSLVWTAGSKYGDYFRYNAPKFLISSLDNAGNTLCAKFNRALIGTEVEGYGFHGSELYLIIQTAEYSTNTEFAQAMQGVMLYYELAEEEIVDISDIIDNTFQEPIEVEAGGTLIFQNNNGDGYRLPIPNEEEYIVSLAEVGGGTDE